MFWGWFFFSPHLAFGMLRFDPYFHVLNVVEMSALIGENLQAMSVKTRPFSAVFSTYSDLGYVQVLCLVTQHWHIKKRHAREIRREERPSDSCLPGWVTLLWDPLRGAQPWVTSVPQSGREDFKHKTWAHPHPSFSYFFCCSSWAQWGTSEDYLSSNQDMNQFRLSIYCNHALFLSLFCPLIYIYCQLAKKLRKECW